MHILPNYTMLVKDFLETNLERGALGRDDHKAETKVICNLILWTVARNTYTKL